MSFCNVAAEQGCGKKKLRLVIAGELCYEPGKVDIQQGK
jgi:ABC-type uncharacterized transport system ATPase component